MSRPTPRSRRRRRILLALLAPVVLVVSLVLLVLLVLPLLGIAKPYRVPTGAMEPTIVPGDVIYARLDDTHVPDRRGLILFHPPRHPLLAPAHDSTFIMRCVGLPGDTIDVANGMVRVNGGEVGLLPHPLPGQRPFIAPDGTFPLTIPPGSYFVVGDNRTNSFDSRYWGYLDVGSMVGYPLARLAPLSRIGKVE